MGTYRSALLAILSYDLASELSNQI